MVMAYVNLLCPLYLTVDREAQREEGRVPRACGVSCLVRLRHRMHGAVVRQVLCQCTVLSLWYCCVQCCAVQLTHVCLSFAYIAYDVLTNDAAFLTSVVMVAEAVAAAMQRVRSGGAKLETGTAFMFEIVLIW